MMKLFKYLTLAASCLILAGCASPPPSASVELDYSHLPTIPFDLARIDITHPPQASTPAGTNDVTHLLPITPEQAVRGWVQDRLRSEGLDGTLTVDIEQADVYRADIKTNDSITDWLVNEQAEKYTGVLQISFIANSSWRGVSKTTTRLTQSVTVGEFSSLHDRELAWLDLVDGLMMSLNDEMVNNVMPRLENHLLGANADPFGADPFGADPLTKQNYDMAAQPDTQDYHDMQINQEEITPPATYSAPHQETPQPAAQSQPQPQPQPLFGNSQPQPVKQKIFNR